MRYQRKWKIKRSNFKYFHDIIIVKKSQHEVVSCFNIIHLILYGISRVLREFYDLLSIDYFFYWQGNFVLYL